MGFDPHLWEASDDVKGGRLPAEMVHAARKHELDYLRRREVYTYSTAAEARKVTGRPPIRLRWIDTDRGGLTERNIRSRLVCTEVRRKGTEGHFSATPPLESL